MHLDTDNASVAHLQTGKNAQNKREITCARIAIPRSLQFFKTLRVVSTGKDLMDCQNWHLSQTI